MENQKENSAIYNTDGVMEKSLIVRDVEVEDLTIKVPTYYEVDFSKIRSFNELLLVLGELGTGLTLYPNEYEKSPIKIFLKESK